MRLSTRHLVGGSADRRWLVLGVLLRSAPWDGRWLVRGLRWCSEVTGEELAAEVGVGCELWR